MMRPIGLFLTEFRADGAPGALRLPAPAAMPLGAPLPAELMDAPDFAGFEAAGFDAAPDFTADTAPASGFGEAFEAPSEPEPDVAALVAALRAEHETALTESRARWAMEEGAVLAERFGQAMAALEQRVTDTLAPLLEPFLSRAARAKAFGQLSDMLGTLVNGGDTRAIGVSGPADLVAALRDAYGDRPGLSFTESAEPDVTIALGDTRIRSQLRAFARKLDAALGA